MARVKQQAEALISLIGEDGVNDMIVQIQNNLKASTKQTKKQSKATNQLSKSVLGVKDSWVMVTVGIGAAIGLARQAAAAAQAIGDQMKEAALEHGIEARFRGVTRAIGGAALVMDKLKQASAGAIDETNLQRLTAMALDGGVKLHQMMEILTLAQKAANKGMGTSIDLTKQFVSAILKGRDGSLRALGLQLNMNKAVQNYALAMGKSTSKVKDAEERQVRYNELLRAGNLALGEFSTEGYVQQFDQMVAKWENLKSEMRRAALMASSDDVRVVALMSTLKDLARLKEKVIDVDIRGGYYNQENLLNAQSAAQQRLRDELEQAPGLLILIKEHIQKLATARVSELGFTQESRARTIALNQEMENIASSYGVLRQVVPRAAEDQEKLNAALRGTKTGAELAADEAAKRAALLEKTEAGIKLAIIGAREKSEAFALEAKYAAQLGRSDIAAEKYAAALKLLPPAHARTSDEAKLATDMGAELIAIYDTLATSIARFGDGTEAASVAAAAMIAKTQQSTQAQFNLEIALASQYATMGKAGTAAKHFRNAMAQVDAGADYTSASLDMIAKAAAQVNNNLAKTLRNMVIVEEGFADFATQASQAERDAARHRAAMIKDRLRGMAQMGMRTTKRRKSGGGGGKSPAATARKTAEEFAKLKPIADALLGNMRADLELVSDAMNAVSGDIKEITSDDSFWYNAADQDGAFLRFQEATEDAAKAMQESIAEIRDRYQKQARADEFKNNRLAQEYLREQMATEIEIVKDRFEAEDALRAQALENEKAYHEARIQAAQMATDVANGMRGELAQYEMDWAQDQLRLGEGLGVALSVIEGQARGIVKIQDELKAAGKDMSQAWLLAAPAMVAGAGQVAIAFIENETAKAFIMAGVEAAASVAAYARGDVIGGTMHASAAAMYATVGGMTAAGVMRRGGGQSGGDKADKAKPSISQPEAKEEAKRAPVNIIVNFTGSTIVGSDQARLQRDFAAILRGANEHGSQTNPEAIGN